MSDAGIAPDAADEEVRAQDDLFRHVNGGWLKSTVIPSDRPLEGSFTQLADASERAVRDIVETAAREPGATPSLTKIGTLYAAFMDTAAINAAGISPVAGPLAEVEAVADLDSFLALTGSLTRSGVQGLCAPFVSNDAGNPDRYLLHLYQSALGMPDESYYREERFEGTRREYAKLLETLLSLAGHREPARAADAVLALETRLAGGHMTTVERRDPQKTYNLYSRAALLEHAPFSSGWLAVVTNTEEQAEELVVSQPEYLKTVDAALAEEPLSVWKEWLGTRVLLHASDYLDDRFVEAVFAFYGTHLGGTPRIKDRWKRAVALVEGALGEAVGQEYVARHFPESSKQTMMDLVSNLVKAYAKSISSREWMTEATRTRALDKLSLFTTKIGYPEEWIDYGPLDIRPGDLYGNVRRASEFEHNRQLNKLGGPIDRGAWLMTPQTVNAYYMPTMNEIVFPAAILQPPFFTADADPAVNYGAIGAVIGHEIGHGFDDQGSRFDGRGALLEWWSEDDRTAFEALTSRLVEQYAALSPAEAPDSKVNGELTLGENIGDLGGLGISYEAYLLSLGGAEPPLIDGVTGAQRFFHSWARCWRQKIRPEEALRRLTVDPHSPNEYRCNQVVRNLDEFHEAFAVRPGDRLWLEPQERVRIW